MQLWEWLIRNHLLLDTQNAIWVKIHSIPIINTLWNASWFKLSLKLRTDWFISDMPVLCLFCSHGLWNRSSVIMEHLQIMFFSRMEMEVSFFILFSLVELWSLMPEMYFLSKSIFSTGWVFMMKKNLLKVRISWAHCISSLWWNADFPLKGKSFFWKSWIKKGT